ncbi:MAG: sigma 54-interacting transcriptional regulator [Desulfomonile tiedjei]|nr:sigma 54-interacting transcriptional regulator [Desulfomonile tiedjei]
MAHATIMIVEDQKTLAEVLANSLASLGYEVLVKVTTGEAAIVNAEELNPDLVLMDIELEGEMDGIEAAEQITSKFNIPVVYMTAHTDESTFRRSTEPGPYGFVTKPFNIKQLQWTIEFALYKQRAEKQLRLSEAKFRDMAELMPQMLFEADLGGKITFINNSGILAAGYTWEDFERGVSFFEVVPPEDHPKLIQHMSEVRGGGRILSNEYTVVRKDGTTFPVIAYAGPIVHDNEVTGFRGVAIDTTEFKEMQKSLQEARDQLEQRVAERTAELVAANKRLQMEIQQRRKAEEEARASELRFRAIFECAQDCIYIKDHSGRYTLVNSRMENLLGLPGSEIIGKTDKELFGKTAGDHLKQVDSRVLRGEIIEEEHTRPVAGAKLTFLDIKVPLRDSDDEVVGICGISRDVTDRRRSFAATEHGESEYPSQAMRTTLAIARRVAETNSTVLLLGPSGSGKDYLARYIHDHSSRSAGPFFSINSAALPPTLAESELFGHESGSFTGAARRKRGLVELAEGGTLFLNEIAELTLPLQTKLLAFLDTKSFRRVGGDKNLSANVRIIAATNKDLEAEVEGGRFRQDLFFRLDVFSIRIPALRRRREDIPVLVQQLLSEIAKEMQISEVPAVDSSTMDKMMDYAWPGNVRELRNFLEKTLIVSRTGQFDVTETGFYRLEQGRRPTEITDFDEGSFKDTVFKLKRRLIEDALKRSGGKRHEAARLLGISRHALKRQMKTLAFDEEEDESD